MPKKEDKLDKIIKLLEEIKANQPIYYYPSIYYYPQPYVNPPWQDPNWTGTTTWEGGANTVTTTANNKEN